MKRIFLSITTALVFAGLFPAKLFAAGYELLEQSAEGTGTAYAGNATGYGDGSEVFYNPAALVDLKSSTASAAVHFVIPHAEFNNKDSKQAAQLGGQSLTGNMGGDAGSLNIIPNAYGAYKANDDIAFGLGVNSPFGLGSDYNDTWVGRYHAVKSSMEIININPAVGVKLSDQFSVGSSMQMIYADAEVSNAIDFGSIGAAALGADKASKLGLNPQQSDGFVDIKADDWGVGFGLGSTYSPTDYLKFGLNWRSRVQLQLDGNADFTLPSSAQVFNANGQFSDTGSGAHITLPESVNFGFSADIDSQWTLLADTTWTRWSRFDELRLPFDSSLPDAVQTQNWNDTWRYSLGARYKPCELWTLKSGITYDETPISSAQYRTPRIPDNNRFWLAVGANYELTPNTSIGFAYAHLFVANADTELTNSSGAVLDGSWDLSVEVASVNVTTRF